MKKVNLIYHAPKGDAKTIEVFGETLVDGKACDVLVPEDRIEKLRSNPVFEVVSVQNDKTPEPQADTSHDKAQANTQMRSEPDYGRAKDPPKDPPPERPDHKHK